MLNSLARVGLDTVIPGANRAPGAARTFASSGETKKKTLLRTSVEAASARTLPSWRKYWWAKVTERVAAPDLGHHIVQSTR